MGLREDFNHARKGRMGHDIMTPAPRRLNLESIITIIYIVILYLILKSSLLREEIFPGRNEASKLPQNSGDCSEILTTPPGTQAASGQSR